MFRLICIASVYTRYFLRRYMPTNMFLDAIRTRRGLKWGVPAMLLALPYLYAASLSGSADRGRRTGLAACAGGAVHLERDEVRVHGTGQRRPAAAGPRIRVAGASDAGPLSHRHGLTLPPAEGA